MSKKTESREVRGRAAGGRRAQGNGATANGASTRGRGSRATAKVDESGDDRPGSQNGSAAQPPEQTPYNLRAGGEAADTLIDYYRQMLLIRRFEEKTGEMYTRAKIGGYCHLNLGEEATIVGAMAALEARDYIFTNYREHGYILARGIEPKLIMAELFGKEAGVSKGRGGSMHMFDVESHFMGGYAIVGGQLPLATGAGLAISYKDGDAVVLCQMGDATTNIGAWHESLNIAQLWKLPVIFLIVNNHYGMGTTVEKASAVPDLYRKACAFDMRSEQVDGNNVLAVRDATRRAAEIARRDKLPSVIDAISFRFRGHSVVDPDRYRSKDEVQRGRARDPILQYGHALREAGYLDEGELKQIDEEVSAIVDEAVAFADDAATPKPEELFTFDYATNVRNVDRSLPGDHTGRAELRGDGDLAAVWGS